MSKTNNTDRSKVAAATAAVVPFHCVICFGEFSLSVRTPVVLPCGHTYVCAPCARRLKRCMECRQPLYYYSSSSSNSNNNNSLVGTRQNSNNHNFATGGRASPNTTVIPTTTTSTAFTPLTPPQQQNNNNYNSNYNYPSTAGISNYSHPSMNHHINNYNHNQNIVQVPFPLPKNVVLMSMMEAAERHARDKPQRDTTVRAAASSGEDDECNDNDSQGDNTNGSMNALDDEEVYDLNRIIGGMATLSGPCGTYAVKDSGGLLVRTALNDDDDENNHHFNENNNNKDGSTDEDAENRSSLLQQPFPISISASEDSIEVKKPSSLERGQTVQVVRFENGVATLARNAGFITATSSQLVKIGGPLETSCQLEGVLETIESRRKELQRDLDETVRIEEQLRRQILAEFNLKEPNYPVITDAPKLEFNSSNSTDSLMDPSTPKTAVKTYKEMQSPDFLPFNPHSFDNTDLCGPGLPRYRSSRGAASFDDNFGCGAAGALFDATADLSGSGATALIEGGSAAAAAAMRDRNRFGGGAGRQQGGNRSRSHSPINGNQHQTGFGGPTLTSSFDTIDFRTGMSGHRGLNNSKLNAGNSPTPRGSFLRMSEHVGIGRVRGPLQRSSASNAS